MASGWSPRGGYGGWSLKVMEADGSRAGGGGESRRPGEFDRKPRMERGAPRPHDGSGRRAGRMAAKLDSNGEPDSVRRDGAPRARAASDAARWRAVLTRDP